MKRVLSGLLLSLGAFIASSLVVTPPAEARRCSKAFTVKRSAGSKQSKRAKRFARAKVWKRARRRCGARRVAVRATKRWQYRCIRRGKLKRCSAKAAFRCCRMGKVTKTKRRLRKKRRVASRSKRRFRRKKRRSRRTKRSLRGKKRRFASRSKRRGKRRFRRGCIGKLALRGSALSRRKATAKKVARSRVYHNAKLRCKRRRPRYVSRWQYRCKRDGKNYACVASNVVRCCSGKRITFRRKRSKRRTKRPSN